METFYRIAELLGVAIGASWITRLLTIKSRVKQEGANAKKAEEEAKQEQLDTIKKIVDEIYVPSIKNLTDQVTKLREEVNEVRKENDQLRKENAELRKENAQIRDENAELRSAIMEIKPALLHPRDASGKFVKKEG